MKMLVAMACSVLLCFDFVLLPELCAFVLACCMFMYLNPDICHSVQCDHLHSDALSQDAPDSAGAALQLNPHRIPNAPSSANSSMRLALFHGIAPQTDALCSTHRNP
jgi:hypothetical protein